MRIDRIELFPVPPRWLFCRVETGGGYVGWGEPVVEGRAGAVRAAVEEMKPYLLGQDAQRINDIFQVLYRAGFYRGGPVLTSALSGLEQALWDIKGKFFGAPVYQLLGGACRDRIRVYGWIGGDRPQDVARAAKRQQAMGFSAIKMNATEEMHYVDSHKKIDEVAGRVAAIREACGPEFGIAVDFHGRVHKPMARALCDALKEFRLLFIEEPVLSENMEAFAEIARFTPAPIATGERLYTRWDFKRLFACGGVDIVQPDVSHAGGILETMRIGAMAEAHDIALAPHCPLGPIALAACLQVDAVCHNAFLQEQSLGIHYNRGNDLLDYIRDRSGLAYRDGFVALPTRPGLGVEVNEEYVRERAKIGHEWKNPVWRNDDGSVAEW